VFCYTCWLTENVIPAGVKVRWLQYPLTILMLAVPCTFLIWKKKRLSDLWQVSVFHMA